MKSLPQIAALFAFSFVLLFQLGLLGVILKPAWFAPAHPTDSLAAEGANPDSLNPGKDTSGLSGGMNPESGLNSSALSARSTDSSVSANHSPASGNNSVGKESGSLLTSAMRDSLARSDSLRTADLKSKAKLLEGVDPETAAKILGNLEDRDVKTILMSIKKRQAGKILGSMEPDRASRILR
jgi:hypothetical protein